MNKDYETPDVFVHLLLATMITTVRGLDKDTHKPSMVIRCQIVIC